jgi:large subunit ribosomal protein L7/L12
MNKIPLAHPDNRQSSLTKVEERKQDTRRKILIGSYYLKRAKQEGRLDELCIEMLGFLTREVDRCFFEETLKK